MNKYGLKFDTPDPKHWVFGASPIPYEPLQEDGDWTNYLPVKEFQNLNGIEPYACVIFTMLNCIEILIKRKYGIERNYSDRFLATVVGTRGVGSSPQEAAEILREFGVPFESAWGMENIDTEDKYFATIPQAIYDLAKEFKAEWDFKHDFVEPIPEKITQALQCSPLLISVSAWYSNPAGRYYRPPGMADNHATTMFYERVGEFRRVFDSYDLPFIKDVEWNALPTMLKRFWIEKKVTPEVPKPSISRWQKFISFLKNLFHVSK